MAQVDQSLSTLKGSARDAGVIQTGLVIYFEQETHRLEKPRWTSVILIGGYWVMWDGRRLAIVPGTFLPHTEA